MGRSYSDVRRDWLDGKEPQRRWADADPDYQAGDHRGDIRNRMFPNGEHAYLVDLLGKQGHVNELRKEAMAAGTYLGGGGGGGGEEPEPPAVPTVAWTEKAEAPVNLLRGSAQHISASRILVVASLGGTYLYNPTNNTWQTLGAPSDHPTSGNRWAMVLAGTQDALTIGNGQTSAQATDKVYRWSGTTTTWTTEANDLATAIYFPSAVAPSADLYAIGCPASGAVENSFQVRQGGVWSNLPTPPCTNYGGVLMKNYTNTALFYAGGRTGTALGDPYSAECWKYTLSSGTWTRMADMPQARDQFGHHATVDNQIVVFGGRTEANPELVYVYDEAGDIWVATTDSFPAAYGNACFALWGTEVWQFGGLDAAANYKDVWHGQLTLPA